MSGNGIHVELEEGCFFEKIIITAKIKGCDFLKESFSTVEAVTDLSSIFEPRIEDIHIEKIKEDEVKITIEYQKVSISSLTESEDMKDKIIAVLKYLEYSEDDIKSVLFYQKYINSEEAWYVEVRNSYDPDESLSQQSEENYMSKLLSKIFKQPVFFSID